MAEDRWAQELHEASYGGIPLDIVSIDDDESNDIVVHTFPRRAGGRLENQGMGPRRTTVRILFFARDPEDDYLGRFASFVALKDERRAHRFVHPITGSYEAQVEAFRYAADAERRDTIAVDCTFIEDAEEPSVYDLGPGAPTTSAVEGVRAASAELDQALEDAGIESSAGADAIATVERWEADDATERQVGVEAAALSLRLQAEVDALGLAEDAALFPVLSAFVALHDALRRAAQAFTQTTERILEVSVAVPTPLLVFCGRFYGAADAQARADEIRRLNYIVNPARIEAGTVLLVPAPTPSGRRPRRAT